MYTFPTLLEAFSMTPKKDDNGSFSSMIPELSRRKLLTWPIGIGGAVVYGKLVADAAQKLSRGDLVYPEAHEKRVQSIISKATVTSIPQETTRPLRVLEVGIGKDWRVERRGFYHTALDQLSASGVSKMQLTGVDIVGPEDNIIEDARRRMKKMSSESGIEVDLNAIQASITSPLNFPDGWFDCVICTLTLCSVDDQTAALQEIKRVLRPNGGTFGYIEHVAVNPGETYKLLDFQQKIFDPLQQAVANNCHLRPRQCFLFPSILRTIPG
jgi:ubiquinone/menaquinone biosynthesis C-methylase UbiE